MGGIHQVAKAINDLPGERVVDLIETISDLPFFSPSLLFVRCFEVLQSFGWVAVRDLGLPLLLLGCLKDIRTVWWIRLDLCCLVLCCGRMDCWCEVSSRLASGYCRVLSGTYLRRPTPATDTSPVYIPILVCEIRYTQALLRSMIYHVCA